MATKSKKAIPVFSSLKNVVTPAGLALACFSICISVVMAFGQGTFWPGEADAQDVEVVEVENTLAVDESNNPIKKDAVCIASYRSMTQNTDAASKANAALAADALDGLEIPQGATLSMREALGDINDGRFQNAPVSAYGISGRMMGGGASQVSSVLYMAALKAGLSVTERHAHPAVVDFALAGTDADVLTQGTDLKIENNLGRDVWIRAVANGQSIEVKIYANAGKPDNDYSPQPISEVVDCVEAKASELLPDPIAVGILPDTVIRGYTVKTYLVTYEDGVERTRELISKDVYAATEDAPVSADKRS